MKTFITPNNGVLSCTRIHDFIQLRKIPQWYNWIFAPIATAIIMLCATWIQMEEEIFSFRSFVIENIWWHRAAWFVGWLFLTLVYLFFLGLTNRPPLAVLFTSLFLYLPALICYYKLQLRGEPFLPWDFAQAREGLDIVGKAGLWITPAICGAVFISSILCLAACFLTPFSFSWKHWLSRTLLPLVSCFAMLFGVFLQEQVTQDILFISPDPWMQDRYYRNYGLVTAFLTNMQVLQIEKPIAYTPETVQHILDTWTSDPDNVPYFSSSYAAKGESAVTTPTIIYIQAEAFWDPSELSGITFDQPITTNIQRTKREMAFGKCYTPRFGGGTCDVECEALTGFSMHYLPNNCKPFVQYIQTPTASIASYRKTQGYTTLAIHGYYAKYWNRENAYANLGFDDFISLEDMTDPERKRPCDWKGGLVTEQEMAKQIIETFESKAPYTPLFLHAVTIQNHMAYSPNNYPDDERVHVLSAPTDISEETIGCLEDFATGVRDTDAMWGTLTNYFDTVDEPVILVLWGDHYNTIGNDMELYTATGYSSDDLNDPNVHTTPLYIWSNYWKEPIDIGTVAAYQITTVTNDLYDLEQSAYFDFLRQELEQYRAKSGELTIQPDGTYSWSALSSDQQEVYDAHWLLQYDLLFGENFQQSPLPASQQ